MTCFDWFDANSLDAYYVHFGAVLAHGYDRQLEGLMADVRIYDEGLSPQRIQAIMDGSDLGGVGEGTVRLQAGDADMDLDFDQIDLVQVQIAAKYLTGQAATWGDGDWDGAPGGEQGNPPTGNGLFDQLDIISALGLDGSFDNAADNNIFKATFGSSFGSLSFGAVAQTGLSEALVINDLTVVGSLDGGGGLGDVDLIYVPEPSALVLLGLGLAGLLQRRTRRRP